MENWDPVRKMRLGDRQLAFDFVEVQKVLVRRGTASAQLAVWSHVYTSKWYRQTVVPHLEHSKTLQIWKPSVASVPASSQADRYVRGA